ncbi:MAG: hypothetical protein LUF27_14445 [Lachnospiraceae bacterium]|nr:hypothetical protein [Lachnospiraceae bacterium]
MTAVSTYEAYLSEPQALTFDQMTVIHQQMTDEIGTDPEVLEYYADLLKAAARYAGIRAVWPMMDAKEKLEKDMGRTSAHDSVITHLNLMSRLLRLMGKPAAWRDTLGNEKDPYRRKMIGDFACYLAFISGINAR